MEISKYKSRKTAADGIEFDSCKEAQRYHALKMLERAGEIQGLRCQVPYELIDRQKRPSGGMERAVRYIADFVYQRDGRTVVEDVKGYRRGTAYNVFSIKRKLMLERHGIEVVEV